MVPKIEKISESLQVGESLHWDSETQSLYLVDIFGQSIHKYVPSTNRFTTGHVGKKTSFIIPVQGKTDQFVISIDRQIALIKWDGESTNILILEILYEVDNNTDNTLNDGKCDSVGRLWAGTFNPNISEIGEDKCSLYNFQNKKVTTLLTKVGASNGLAFDDKLKKFYHIDILSGTLNQYDFDVTRGTIFCLPVYKTLANGKPIYTLNPKGGFTKFKQGLDGMAIDIDGNLWVAVFNGSRVIKIDPRKPDSIATSIQLPVKQVTSVAFGGPNLDELYVTTGKMTIFDETPSGPDDGALFKITGLGTKGLPGVGVVL
ncbi:hypothetical protein NQ318_011752 [Aromia moschata]|uniref:SMP-30/Gluconolactonase/LRE-like region domain-containing protein n=1 Tax=Aromia moschata TaxID=1265417 RepID=A0AAV8XZC0_9CUCU|nr:hypothetical protein NQ318_011752 [Aromia moschata]